MSIKQLHAIFTVPSKATQLHTRAASGIVNGNIANDRSRRRVITSICDDLIYAIDCLLALAQYLPRKQKMELIEMLTDGESDPVVNFTYCNQPGVCFTELLL